MEGSTNSRRTRVRPIFRWLNENEEEYWPERLVSIADGLDGLRKCGAKRKLYLDPERRVPATLERLTWMIENVDRLAPHDGRRWKQLLDKAASRNEFWKRHGPPKTRDAFPQDLVLEGSTSCDCLIECDHVLIWIEGKRNDWLAPSIKWDVGRDQLARNVEAVWSLAQKCGKDYAAIICHEHPLKVHEAALIEGYRRVTWSAGLAHLCEQRRRELGARIGTVTWTEIAEAWPQLRREVSELCDLR